MVRFFIATLSAILICQAPLGQSCSLGYECCQAKSRLEGLLEAEGALGGGRSLRDLKNLHDELIARIILAEGLRRADTRAEKTVIEQALQKLASSDEASLGMFKDFIHKRGNRIGHPGYSALGTLLGCDRFGSDHTPSCQIIVEADDERKDFLDASGAGIAASFRAAGSRRPEEIRSEDTVSLRRRLEEAKKTIRQIQDSGQYAEMQELKRQLADELYRDCAIDEGSITVEKACLTDTFSFGEVKSFSADITDVLRSLEPSRPPSIGKRSAQTIDRKRRNERFLDSYRKGYFRGGVRLGDRPGNGYLFAGALRRSMPAVGGLLMASLIRPNNSGLEYGAKLSKINEYLYKQTLEARPQFFSPEQGGNLPCFSTFCGHSSPYFYAPFNTSPGSIFAPSAPLQQQRQGAFQEAPESGK